VEKWNALAVAVAFGLASWPQYYPVTEERHLFWAASPMIGLFVYVLNEFFSRFLRSSWAPRVAVLTSALFFVGGGALTRYERAMERFEGNSVTLEKPPAIAGIRVKETDAENYMAVYNVLSLARKRFPEKSIITTGYDALYLCFLPTSENWHPMYVFFDIGVEVYPAFPSALKKYIEKNKPIIITPGHLDYSLGYEYLAYFRNGLAIGVPGSNRFASFLTEAPSEGHIVQHVGAPYTSTQRNIMQVTGGRNTPVDLEKDFSLEIIVRPAAHEGPRATIVANLYGPDHGEGIALQRSEAGQSFELLIGQGPKRGLSILSFTMIPNELNYVVIRRKGMNFDVWVNGFLKDCGEYSGPIGGQRNTVFLGNGISRMFYFSGEIFEYAFWDIAIPAEDLAKRASSILTRIDSLPLSFKLPKGQT